MNADEAHQQEIEYEEWQIERCNEDLDHANE